MTVTVFEVLLNLSAFLWLMFSGVMIAFLGSYMTVLAWDFFTASDKNHTDAPAKPKSPFPKNYKLLYKWKGDIELEVATLCNLKCTIPFGLVEVVGMKWDTKYDDETNVQYKEIVVTFHTKKIEDVSYAIIQKAEHSEQCDHSPLAVCDVCDPPKARPERMRPDLLCKTCGRSLVNSNCGIETGCGFVPEEKKDEKSEHDKDRAVRTLDDLFGEGYAEACKFNLTTGISAAEAAENLKHFGELWKRARQV